MKVRDIFNLRRTALTLFLGNSNLVAPAPLTPMNRDAQANEVPRQLTLADRRRIFKQIIVKCVLQLLLIETTHELLQNQDVYNTIPAQHLLRFMGVLDDSYQFARKFNADKELRMALWRVGASALTSLAGPLLTPYI